MIIYYKKYRVCAEFENDLDNSADEFIVFHNELCAECPLYAICNKNTTTNDAILDDIIKKCSYSELCEDNNSEYLYIRNISPINIYKLFI